MSPDNYALCVDASTSSVPGQIQYPGYAIDLILPAVCEQMTKKENCDGPPHFSWVAMASFIILELNFNPSNLVPP